MRPKVDLLVTVCLGMHEGWITCSGSICSVSCACPQKLMQCVQKMQNAPERRSSVAAVWGWERVRSQEACQHAIWWNLPWIHIVYRQVCPHPLVYTNMWSNSNYVNGLKLTWHLYMCTWYLSVYKLLVFTGTGIYLVHKYTLCYCWIECCGAHMPEWFQQLQDCWGFLHVENKAFLFLHIEHHSRQIFILRDSFAGHRVIC